MIDCPRWQSATTRPRGVHNDESLQSYTHYARIDVYLIKNCLIDVFWIVCTF